VDELLAYLTNRLQQLTAGWLGPDAERPLIGSVTAADLLIVAIFLGATLLANVLVGFIMRRAKRSGAGPLDRAPGGPALRHHAFVALGKPIYVFLWVYGVYFAATPVLLRLRPEHGLTVLRSLLDLLFDLGGLIALFWFLFRATHVLQSHLAVWAAATPGKIDDLLVPLAGTTLRILVLVIGVTLAIPMLGAPPQFANVLAKLTSILLITAVAVLLVRAVAICEHVVLMRFDLTVADNLRARKVYTQIHVITRVSYVTIGIFGVAATLMLFQEVRHVGTSLLASAGIVGIIAGVAAQKTLANLFAGFQIALAQPVRQDDVVVVEGEWGRIEEITLTTVVVHIWDDRRLVLPLSYFIEKPFQNWTRTSSALLGSVFLWVDYSLPLDAARQALARIVEASPLWDRRFWNLQVSDASERTMQLRVLATASDSSRSWDLRCEIREKFIAYIQTHHPGSLPRLRTEVSRWDAPAKTAPNVGD